MWIISQMQSIGFQSRMLKKNGRTSTFKFLPCVFLEVRKTRLKSPCCLINPQKDVSFKR